MTEARPAQLQGFRLALYPHAFGLRQGADIDPLQHPVRQRGG